MLFAHLSTARSRQRRALTQLHSRCRNQTGVLPSGYPRYQSCPAYPVSLMVCPRQPTMPGCAVLTARPLGLPVLSCRFPDLAIAQAPTGVPSPAGARVWSTALLVDPRHRAERISLKRLCRRRLVLIALPRITATPNAPADAGGCQEVVAQQEGVPEADPLAPVPIPTRLPPSSPSASDNAVAARRFSTLIAFMQIDAR